jgi:hypothetical protein
VLLLIEFGNMSGFMKDATVITMSRAAAWLDDYGQVRVRFDIASWLEKNIGKKAIYSSKWGWKGRWTIITKDNSDWHFCFTRPRDALLFKMTWAGQ